MKGVYNRKLSDLIATYQIPIPFSFVGFRDFVVQYSQRIPNIVPHKLEVNAVGNGVDMNTCFACGKAGHLARDWAIKREPPTCYCCKVIWHIAPKCKARDVYCQICKNNRHVTDTCFTKRAPRPLRTTAGSTPAHRINAATQEFDREVDDSLSHVSGRVTGSAFALAEVSMSASGRDNLVMQLIF